VVMKAISCSTTEVICGKVFSLSILLCCLFGELIIVIRFAATLPRAASICVLVSATLANVRFRSKTKRVQIKKSVGSANSASATLTGRLLLHLHRRLPLRRAPRARLPLPLRPVPLHVASDAAVASWYSILSHGSPVLASTGHYLALSPRLPCHLPSWPSLPGR